MKTKETLLLFITALVCTYLFYNEAWGLNVPLFALLLIGTQIVHKPQLKKNKAWLCISSAMLVSAVAYYFTNNDMAVCLFVISIVFSSGIQLKNSMLLFLPAHAFLNFLIAPFSLITEWAEEVTSGKPSRITIRMFVIPMVIFSVFLIVYANANQRLFEQLRILIKEINISILLCFILSFIIILPLIKGRIITWLSFIEDHIEKLISFISEPNQNENTEKVSRLMKEAIVVFSSLILLLTYLIALDAYDLFLSSPTASLSKNLHGSIYTLIFSMFLAIGVILYYFSLPIIYDARFGRVKLAVHVWIALNLVLCIICVIKNNLYVQEFGLTYKRIGVYTYLIATACALLITAYKTRASLNNWLLIKANTWMIYGIFLIFACIPWDLIITRYNMNYTKNPDIAYIKSLSATARLEYYKIELQKDSSALKVNLLKNDLIKTGNQYLITNNGSSILSLTAEDLLIKKEYDQLSNELHIKSNK